MSITHPVLESLNASMCGNGDMPSSAGREAPMTQALLDLSLCHLAVDLYTLERQQKEKPPNKNPDNRKQLLEFVRYELLHCKGRQNTGTRLDQKPGSVGSRNILLLATSI